MPPLEVDLLAFDYEIQSARRQIPDKLAAAVS